jgi:N-succinyl-L-ornithine transcarbamylase
MKYFTCAQDVPDLPHLLADAIKLKHAAPATALPGKGKTLGLIFMNPSLRTRLSTQKAAQQLGMNILAVNATTEGWTLEFSDAPMIGTTVEHVNEAAAVLGEYCDIVGVRSFPSLTDRAKDDREEILLQWMNACKKPFISLESATRHPLQSFADLITIEEQKKKARPKVVLTWAPHVKPVPQAVANSFAEWMLFADVDFSVACPEGMELNPEFTGNAPVFHNQQEAIEEADFIYVKSWASWKDYGKFHEDTGWLLDERKLKSAPGAKIMHCLPVRRDVELSASLIESHRSLVVAQAANRVWSAQAVLKKMLESNYPAKENPVPENELMLQL